MTARQRDSLTTSSCTAASRAPRHAFEAGRNVPHRLAATNHPLRGGIRPYAPPHGSEAMTEADKSGTKYHVLDQVTLIIDQTIDTIVTSSRPSIIVLLY
eukprot:COSAG06_NODE_6881_length_2730_cov_12.025846_3_plen_99_part_00